MTDSPTPPAMTPEQRAQLVILGFDLAREGCDESAVIAWTDGRAVFFEGDQLAVVLALTAERDAAQAEIARLTAALATAREDDGNPRPIETAPKDGTMLRLLVDYEGVENWMPLTDDNQSWTIGFNTLEDTGDDEWIIAGWNWSQDCFGTGEGKVIGWLPFAAITKGTAT